MSEQRPLDPQYAAVHAAHEVVIELIRSGAMETKNNVGSGDSHGESVAEAVIAAHKKLTEYYQTLAK